MADGVRTRDWPARSGAPLGGYQQSGFDAKAFADLEHYTHSKYVVIDLERGGIGIFK